MSELWAHAHKTKARSITVNWLIARPSLSNRILSLIRSFSKPFFHAHKPDRYTIGHDYTYSRASDSLSITEYVFAFLFALAAVVIFVQYVWFLYDLDRAFRAWLQAVK